jgi:hypothetical protein
MVSQVALARFPCAVTVAAANGMNNDTMDMKPKGDTAGDVKERLVISLKLLISVFKDVQN